MARQARRACNRGAGPPRSSGAATGETRNAQRNQNTACPLIRLGSHVEKNGMYVTMLIALKIAR